MLQKEYLVSKTLIIILFLIDRWQTKPKLTIHGDLYYEGKEFETKLKEKKPGELSEELRTALGMPTGGVSKGFVDR